MPILFDWRRRGWKRFPWGNSPFRDGKKPGRTESPGSNQGYIKGAKVQGFSHIHVSGTGGGFKYGNILVAPVLGDFDPADYRSEVASDYATPGYFEMRFENNIHVDLTATKSAGFHQYTFPASAHAKILIDAGACLGESSFS